VSGIGHSFVRDPRIDIVIGPDSAPALTHPGTPLKRLRRPGAHFRHPATFDTQVAGVRGVPPSVRRRQDGRVPEPQPALVLRRPAPADEAQVRGAARELAAEGFDFAPLLDDLAWPDWLATMADREAGLHLPEGIVPETFVLATLDGVVVGRGSVRHRLTPALERLGGHVGYAVRPGHRRRGYATVILRGCLDLAAAAGVHAALVTCADTNTASARTIERAGGVLRDVLVDADGRATRRYDVPTARA